ncbi:MAG: hypothetical protein ACJAZS_000467 [Alteromonas naphthalenivorans]|jgi:hypothetical protein
MPFSCFYIFSLCFTDTTKYVTVFNKGKFFIFQKEIYMKQTTATFTLSTLLLLSLSNVQAGVTDTAKDTVSSSRNLVVTQVRGAMSAVAQGVDKLMYPAIALWVGTKVYDAHVQEHMPETPQAYTDIESMIPYGNEITPRFIRLVTGCVAIAGAHALVNTDTVGGFIDNNMPNLSRLLHHVGAENGLKSKRSSDKVCGL